MAIQEVIMAIQIDRDVIGDIRGQTVAVASVAPKQNPLVIPKAAKIAAGQQEEARRQGFADPKPWFENGTKLFSGEYHDRSRIDHDAKPLLKDGCGDLANLVRAESRRDMTVPIVDLRMLADGQIERRSVGKPIPCEERGLYGLLMHTEGAKRGASYIAGAPLDLRVHNSNYWFERAGTKEAQLRLRNGTGPLRLWATVGPNYGRFDLDTFADLFAKVLPESARVECAYDGYRGSIRATWHDRTAADEFGVGQAVTVGICGRTADDGSGRWAFSAAIEWARCRNLSIDKREIEVTSGRHTGAEIGVRVEEALKRSLDRIKPFVDAWTAAEKEQIVETGTDPVKVFAALVERGYVPTAGSGVTKDELTKRLVDAYGFQPGYSKAAVLNAVTRMAHTHSWQSKWYQEELEQTSGALVYQRLHLSAE